MQFLKRKEHNNSKLMTHVENWPIQLKILPGCWAAKGGQKNLLRTKSCDINDTYEMSETCSA